MKSLENKVIVIAGAAGGIGSATARHLARHGAKVILASRTNEALESLLAEIREISPESEAFGGDLCRKRTWLGLIDFVQQRYYRLDRLINCTGTLNPKEVVHLTSDEIDSEIKNNVESLIFGVQVVLPLMRQQRRGAIVTIGSLGGIVPMPFSPFYCATKHAVRGFSLSINEEYRGSGLSFSLLTLGPVSTKMLDREARSGQFLITFINKPLQPDRVAQAVLSLLRRPRPELIMPPATGALCLLSNLSPRFFALCYRIFPGGVAGSAFTHTNNKCRSPYHLLNGRMTVNIYAETAHLKTFSLEFLKAYIITMRPYLMFVSGITGLVGMSFNTDISTSAFMLRFAASFLSYGFGQALTDCFQIDTDSLSSPYRPLTRGVISRIQTFLVSAVGLTFCIAVFASGNLLNVFLGAITGGGLATYTFFKRRWWGGPFYNAWIVSALCLMAFLSGGESVSYFGSPSIIWVLLCVLFAYANFVLSGYFKDIEADRATGYNTLPVVFGRRVSAWISDLLAAIAVSLAFVCVSEAACPGLSSLASFAEWIVFFVAAGVSLLAQVRLHRVSTDNEAHRAIVPVVHAYILLLSSIIVSQKPEWGGFLYLFYGAFVSALTIRPATNQI